MPSTNSSFWICPLYGFSYDVDNAEKIQISPEVGIWRIPDRLQGEIDDSTDQLELDANEVNWGILVPYHPARTEPLTRETATAEQLISYGLASGREAEQVVINLVTTLRLLQKGNVAPGPLLLSKQSQ